jgi:hypothetical protein
VGGAALADTVTTNVGVLLGAPSGVQFSQDGTYVLLAEAYSMRITKWSTATGAYLGSVGSGYRFPFDVTECWTGTGVGTVVPDYLNARFAVVSETGVVTTSTTAAMNSPTAIELVPGVGTMVVAQGSSQIMVLSSVAIATHPVSATVAVSATATFSVTLTANSATTGLTYVWTVGGVVVGSNSASLSIATTDANGGWFSVVCTVKHAMGQAVSNAGNLIVQASALKQSTEFVDDHVRYMPSALSCMLRSAGPGTLFFLHPAITLFFLHAALFPLPSTACSALLESTPG